MDSAGSRSATIFGHSEGGNVSLLFAATHPDRTDRLILTGSYAKRIRSDDYPWAPTMEEREAEVAAIEAHWGSLLTSPITRPAVPMTWPSSIGWPLSEDVGVAQAAATLLRLNSLIDTTPILPTIQVPTLLLYREGRPGRVGGGGGVLRRESDTGVEGGAWDLHPVLGLSLDRHHPRMEMGDVAQLPQ